MARGVKDGEGAFFRGEVGRLIIGPAFHLLDHLCGFDDGSVGIIREAELAQHVRQPHETQANSAPSVGGFLLLGQRMMAAIPGQHVVQKPHAQTGGLF